MYAAAGRAARGPHARRDRYPARVPTTAGEPAAPASRASAATPWLALGAIVLLAALLRFATLRTQSIWFDEAATWDLVRRPFGEMLRTDPRRREQPAAVLRA